MAARTGRAVLVSIVALASRDESLVLACAASLVEGLDAALGAAILDSARERGLPIRRADRLRETHGGGATGSLDGRPVVVGSAALLADLGISLHRFGEWPERLRQRGEHVLFAAIEGRAAACFGIAITLIDTHSSDMEESMQRTAATANRFPTATTGLPVATETESFELADEARFDLRISPVVKSVGGHAVRMLAYNGSIPGPTLRVRQGSTLLVNVINDGDLDATVHWHGLRLHNRYDGTMATQAPIPVGGAFTYRLSFPDPGIYWYHPHIREDYGQEMGLSGTIIVAPSEPHYWPAANREIALTLDDLLLEEGGLAPFDVSQPTFTAMGRFGNVLLVNGELELSLRARTGEVIRFYLTNTANARVFNVTAAGARMKLVGGDSGRYEHEKFVDSVVIAPSERTVVDVLFERAGQVAFEHHTPGRVYQLGTISVDAQRAAPWLAGTFGELRTNPEMAAERARIASYVAAAPDRTLALVAEMNFGDPQSSGATLAYACPMHPDVTGSAADRCPRCGMKLVPAQLIEQASHGHHDEHGSVSADPGHDSAAGRAPALPGIEWEDDMADVNRMTNPTNTRWKLVDRQTGAVGADIDWRFRVGDQVKIRIVNELVSDHPMQHPFHIHGAGRFLILSRDGAAEPNLVWKDTVLVPTGQTVDILLDVTHPGVWMAHCHIAEHHESGMFLTFHVDA